MTVIPNVTAPATGIGMFPAMDLAEVNARAGLQTRVDAKYLITPRTHAAFVARMAEEDDWSCLEIGGRREFRYVSTYFDTPDLLTFHQHRQDRRRRFKVRTREYADTGECAFEVKLEGARNSTAKERLPHQRAHAGQLTGRAWEFLEDVLRAAYRMPPPSRLAPAATTTYLRHTLVQRSGAARVTLDTGLVCGVDGRWVEALPMWAVETKSAAEGGTADRVLWSLGARPLRVSKYCMATAVLHGIPANPWNRALRLWFGTAATPRGAPDAATRPRSRIG
ncbi:VTC domain-containing protein [Halostreptopolyspora alba]|uniref:VTC domain-containing protein n=1 Tax=Halostreptopolyspora alba TaxID=2487137 RepID=A0A3N0ECX7_9ACTN|nr:VTC domain-containing protein [Nocardiopsaceae bacterium YIM 96095]